MSRPHFLADNDLNDAIVMGVLRREPTIEFARLRDLGLATRADPEVLDHAAREKWTDLNFLISSFIASWHENRLDMASPSGHRVFPVLSKV